MDAHTLVNKIIGRLSSQSDLSDTTKIAKIIDDISNAQEEVNSSSSAQNAKLLAWLNRVEALTKKLSDLVNGPLRSSSSSGTRQKHNSKKNDCTSIEDVASRLKGLAEYCKKVTQFEAEANATSQVPDDTKLESKSTEKLCLDYCSLFPEDYEFDVPQLINLWTAEGYLGSEPEQRGQEYVREFRSKSFFKDAKEDERGRTTTCKMNSLIHGLAALITNDKSISMDPNGDAVHEGLQHVSFHHSINIPDSLFDMAKNLQTILLPAITRSRLPDEMIISTSTCKRIFSRFKKLRVLDLHNLGIKDLPPSIGDLKSLEYLDLSENNIDRLPSSITKLIKLKTLKLSHCYGLKELPKDLKQLKSLRHLEIEGCLYITHMPPGMKDMTSLRTLSHFVVSESDSKEDLAGLKNLTEMEISHLERLKCMASDKNGQPESYLKDKEKLEVLTLRWDHDNVNQNKSRESSEEDSNSSSQLERLWPHNNLKVFFVMGYRGKEFQPLSSFKCLVKFSLYNCPSCVNIPPLDNLPLLKILKFQRLNSLEYIDQRSDSSPKDFFKALKELSIWDCPELTSWWKAANIKARFAQISTLEIRYCPKLTRMPLFTGLDEQLILVSSSGKPLDTTLAEGENPLSNLNSVEIANVKKESPEEWIKKFKSLEVLCIRECPLKSLPQRLTKLTSVTIENSEELFLPDNALQDLGKLRCLTIRGIPKLKSFPSKLEGLTCLKDLELHSCRELTSLPASIDKLESLSMLVLSECHELASLPKEIRELKNLETLIIRDCPLLLPRCQRETGDDWPNISHIKKIILTQTSQGF